MECRFFRFVLFFAVVIGTLFIVSCEKREVKTELTVSAAANFTNVLKKCAEVYEAENKNTKILLNFAATGVLASQIIAGAPVDVFFSATEKHAYMIIEKGFGIGETKRILASNEIVVVSGKNLQFKISTPADLLNDGVKTVALGNPETVAAGISAKESLETHGIYEKVKAKTVYGENVRQVLEYVKKGEADAGIVFYTDFLVAKKELNLNYTFDKSSDKPIIYPVLVVKNSKNRAASEKFIQFLESPAAKEIFKEFGYVVQ